MELHYLKILGTVSSNRNLLIVFKDGKSLLSENTNSLKGKLSTETDLVQESLFVWSRMELNLGKRS